MNSEYNVASILWDKSYLLHIFDHETPKRSETLSQPILLVFLDFRCTFKFFINMIAM